MMNDICKTGEKRLTTKYSIVFIVDRDGDKFWEFFELIRSLFIKIKDSFEILIIANASERIIVPKIYSDEYYSDNLSLLVFEKKVPHVVCMKSVLGACSGTFIFSLSAFQELTYESYAKLINSMSDGVDMVVPYRRVWKDTQASKVHSKALNIATKYVMNIKLNDIGCIAKIFRKEIFEEIDMYGNMYLYFSGLAAQKGFKIKEVECEQSDKNRTTGLYEWKLYLNRGVEILNLFFSVRYSKKPLRFFNFIGSILFLIGIFILLYVGAEKYFYNVQIGDKNSLIVGLICFIGGVQIASLGLVGEIITFVYGRSKKEYRIEKII